MINSCVVAAIHVAGVRGDPCGAVRWTDRQNFKILTINSGVVAAIHVAGVRGDPCGAVRWTDRQNFKILCF